MAERKFTENFNLAESKISENKITGVKILGSISKNMRKYKSKALEAVSHLAQGLRVVCDHPGQSVRDIFGYFENVSVDSQNELVRGDLVLLESHPFGKSLREMATVNPELVGMSIDGQGLFANENDGDYEIVEDVLSLKNIACVTNAATANSLYEEKEGNDLKKINDGLLAENKKLKDELQSQILYEHYRDFWRKHHKYVEEDNSLGQTADRRSIEDEETKMERARKIMHRDQHIW